MSKLSKYILILIIIAIVILAVYATYIEKNEINNTVATNGNSVTNDINENINNTVENNVVPTVEPKVETPPEKSIIESTTLTKEEKAKELAKQKWGGTDGVYFSVDNINSDETYVISVRDSATTKVLEWYTVNINTGDVKN